MNGIEADQVEVLDLDAETASVAAARRFVARAFAGRVPRDIVADLVLATSELVTNAIEHGQPAEAPVRVTVAAGPSTAAIAVRSAGGEATLGAPEQWGLPSPEVRTGRGLGIVRQVSDQVDVHHADGTLEIVAQRRW